MSDGEQKLADTTGKFVQVVVDGRKVNDLEWLTGRILLSTKRLVLVTNDGKQTIPLSKIQSVKNRTNVQTSVSPVGGYFSLQLGSDVYLLAPSDIAAFEESFYSALLDGTVVLVKHPAVEGGVVQDTTWQKGQLSTDTDEVGIGVASGQFVDVELDDVGGVEQKQKPVRGDERRVLEIEHTLEGETSVETHVSGAARHVAILESLVGKGLQENATDVELSQAENEVLMALYSGVSPFEIPDFVGLDVDEVEDIFDRLVEAGFLEKKRTRRDVQLKARGRNIASDVIGDQ